MALRSTGQVGCVMNISMFFYYTATVLNNSRDQEKGKLKLRVVADAIQLPLIIILQQNCESYRSQL